MEHVPFFSILVPVYNMSGKLDRCVSSIKAQTFVDYEVIFVDDGSTDRSYDELCAIAAGDARCKVIRHDRNRSLLCARYTGMENAAGKYIFFLDSDDCITPDALESLYAHIAKDPADIIRFGFTTYSGSYTYSPTVSEDPFGDFCRGKEAPGIWKNCISSATVKKAVAEITPFYCNSGEDTFMSCTLYYYAKSFSRLDRQ
ncbi:MAG: glycosyltransferase family 2 protein, partial [Clostridia bacterium]|nr:glycosyltransferase family 2 protein [Clostridia bacterium]